MRIRPFISLLAVLLLVLTAGAQTKSKTRLPGIKQTDTIFTRFSMCGTIRGDTVLFGNSLDNLKRYFGRNLRCPTINDSMITGYCTLYFLIAKDGAIGSVWYDSATHDAVGNEVVRVAKKMGALRPSFVKGRTVVTIVKTKVVYVSDEEAEIAKWDTYETDILIPCYSIPKRRVQSGKN